MNDKDNSPNSPTSNSEYKIISTASPKSYSTEWFLNNYFEHWTPQTLETAIKTNYIIDIAEFGNQIVTYVMNQFIAWSKTYRSDLYKILITPGGKKWLKILILHMMKQIQ